MSTVKNILIADDELTNLDILSHSLTKNGYNVVCCQNGMEALTELNKQPDFFDIALLDRMMPELDGIELLLKIKKDKNLKDIAVIMQSAKSLPQEVNEGIESGAIEYLTKPYNTAELLNALDSVGRGSHISKKNEEDKILDVVDFEICNPEDITLTALYIANLYPEPQKVQFEIKEIIQISVETANLAISPSLQKQLLAESKYEYGIKKPLSSEIYTNNATSINFTKYTHKIILKIKNNGDKINWNNFCYFKKVKKDSTNDSIIIFKSSIFEQMQYDNTAQEISCLYIL